MYIRFKAGICGSEILDQVCCNPSLVPIGLVVEVDHVRLRIELSRIGDIVFDRVDVREGLHTEFAVEAATKRVEDLILLLSAVPYIPLMHVTDGLIR